MASRLLSSIAVVAFCATTARAADVDYVRDVKPLLKQHCYTCHGALKQESKLRLDTGGLIRKGGETGPAVVVGKPLTESPIIRRITATDPAVRMPHEGKPLTEQQIAIIKAWIEQGTTSPADEKPEVDPKHHWSFQPVTRPAVPQVKNTAWVRNPIDAFVAADQEKHGLTPLPAADKATLLRRVTIDLTGLPPTPDELHAFLNDHSSDAYEKVVDRLLASPQYGERWGRHWMDVWRYSDWYGRRAVPDVMNSYPMIWRWRDWIVRSLNEDKGYDRMVVEMLAADEVAPADDANVVATGFLARNFYKWNYNTWMRDDVEHTGKAFLGLTLNCCHCHDHKYDPITKEEYFKFRAFFEPLEMRHDRVAGEPDPGPFKKYVYAESYGPITSGKIRVFDEKLDAETFMYNKGDERQRVEGKPPIPPGVPAALGGEKLDIKPVDLPVEAWYPGFKPWVQQEELSKLNAGIAAAEVPYAERKKKLEVAEPALEALQKDAASAVSDPDGFRDSTKPAAQLAAATNYRAAQLSFRIGEVNLRYAWALLRSLEARIAADKARFGGPSPSVSAPELARAASRAEREAEHVKAEYYAAVAEEVLFGEARAPAKTPQAQQALAAARAKFIAAEATEAQARAALAADSDKYSPIGPVYPRQSTGRRTALAKWIASPKNPLTARVAANHTWLRHFGVAIVPSTFDFGRNGKPPTNQELLDWLACELMDHGWSMKHLHKLLVTSNTYRTASAVPARRQDATLAAAAEAAGRKLDPDNTYLWRFNAKRMEAEVVRDSALAVAGELDKTMGGPDIDLKLGQTVNRRSIYFTIHGEEKMKMLELFDAPEVTDCYKRTETVVPQQALAMSNSDLTVRAGRKLAAKLWESTCKATPNEGARDAAFITGAFEQILSRAPSDDESATCATFLARQSELVKTAVAANAPAKDPAARAREDLVHALLNHNDFVTVR
jgi:mono/diheme cytochrome c family protein